MILNIEHRLTLEYDAYISESFLELRVEPKTTAEQTVHTFTLSVGPSARVFRYRDWADNIVHHFGVGRFHDRIEVVSRSVVTTLPAPPPLASIGPVAEGEAVEAPHQLDDFVRLDGPVRPSAELRRFHRGLRLPRTTPLGERVAAISRHVHGHLTYRQDVTRFDSTTDDVLRLRAGVCQDFTHLALGLLRLSGIPARYVSGYLHVERTHDEPSQSHAWLEFWAPGRGWVPYDPTHDRAIDERYVVVAHGRHYDDVPPNRGTYRGIARETLRAEVRTRPITLRSAGALREEIQTIDLPVYAEVPERRRMPAVPGAPAEAVQQQQQ